MDLVNGFKAFFLSIFTRMSQVLLLAAALPPPPAVVEQQQLLRPAAPVANQHNLDWAMVMIGFCLPSAVEIALQSMQIHTHFPMSFHFLSLAIIFSFTSLFLSKIIDPRFLEIAKLLERAGLLLAVTAIYIAITIPLPMWLKCITWTVFAISLVAIIVSHHYL